MEWVTILGSVAGVLTATSFLPQVLHTWRSRSTGDISLGMYSVYCFSSLLWVIYAWLIRSWPLLITNTIVLVMACVILVLKLRYK